MKNNTSYTEHAIMSADYEPAFSCEIIQGISYSGNEGRYNQILKDTYDYKPELHEHELFDSEFRLIGY